MKILLMGLVCALFGNACLCFASINPLIKLIFCMFNSVYLVYFGMCAENYLDIKRIKKMTHFKKNNLRFY